MMNQLIALLHEGNHSLVVTNNGEPRCYDGRGVSDLLRLLNNEPQQLSGADVADKVVGKAAVAIMIVGGVRRVYADIVSEQALPLATAHLQLTYGETTPHIVNRQQTGWCPMEQTCRNCTTAEDCVRAIRKKLKEINK